MENLKFNKDEMREFGLGVLEQNLTKEQLPYYVAGHYKAKAENNSIMLLLSVLMNIILILVTLILIWVIFI